MNIMNIITNNQFFSKRNIAIGIGGITIIILAAVYILISTKTQEQNPRLHNFERYGFSLLVPESFDNVVCNNENMFVTGDTVEKPEFSAFCKNDSTRSAPFIMVGWKPKDLENAEFSKKIMAYFTGKFFGEGKKFKYACDNKTGIVTAVGTGIGARAFSCAVDVEGVESYTVVYYIFYTGKNADTTNWIIMTDVANPGSVSKEKMTLLAKGIKLEAKQKQSMFINAFIQTAHADPSDGDGAEGGAGGEGPSGGSGTGSLGSDTSTSGTVSDSFGGTVGSGCSGCSSGGPDGTSGSGSGSGVVNGACSATHYSCSAGTSVDNVSTISAWTWTCNGAGGGANASCTENKPTPTGTLQASPLACQIATGASSCSATLTWSTANPQGTSGVTRDGTAGLLFSANSDSRVTNVPYEADGAIIYRLYNNAAELGNATIAVSCASGANKWDTAHGVCADPQVVSAVVRGEYYPPGNITLTCSDSDTYSVTLEGSPFVATTPYSGPAVISVSQEGNYTLKCMYGNISSQTVRFYDAIPPPATVSLEVSPVTIAKDGKVTASWKTKFPTNECSLTAKVVCPNDACTAQQTSFQSALNSKLQTEKTDSNDPATSRHIPTAIKVVAPGHIDTDWLALGRKTLQISYTTDLIYDCGGTSKQTKRIQVTKLEDQ